jgi:hypothetical protein
VARTSAGPPRPRAKGATPEDERDGWVRRSTLLPAACAKPAAGEKGNRFRGASSKVGLLRAELATRQTGTGRAKKIQQAQFRNPVLLFIEQYYDM